MSGFDAEFERLRREVEEAVGRVLELVKRYSSRLSEIEGKVGLEDSRGLWEFLKEVKGFRFEAKDELLKAKRELLEELRAFREKLREAAEAEPGRRGELREVFEDLKEFLEDRFDEAEDSLEEFLDRVEDVEDEIRDRIRELKRGVRKEVYAVGFGVPDVPRIARVPEVKIPDIGKLIEESLSKAFSGASMIVSSVRLPRVDLDLIDALVESGIFKSRNEGIAFFAHRGIEASSDWLGKVREKLEEIKRLQEETKREMERMLGEPPEKPGEEGGEKKD